MQTEGWATHFFEIPDALENNPEVKSLAIDLIEDEPLQAKSLDGGDRKSKFRNILTDHFTGVIGFEEAKRRVNQELPRSESPHRHDNRTFNKQWIDRLVRSGSSRFYNHAVLLTLEDRGEKLVYVPESPHQDRSKKCTQRLVGREIPIQELRMNLERAYRHEEWEAFPRIPFKPNCTHTVIPVDHA